MELARKHPNDKAKVILGVRQLDKNMKAPPANHSPPSASTLHAPAPKLQTAAVKPRKNESSAIYGKRDKDRKKKRGSDSESEGQMSDAESEMDWSDEEGPRKRKRKNEEVIKPEKAALKAFNEATIEELTGTIGKSALFLHFIR
jgi:SWI/SNF-related matrix-associated actin-dependent regulator 1 of chromatin subfamily A